MRLQVIAQHVRDPVMGERGDFFCRGVPRGVDRLSDVETQLGRRKARRA